MRTPVSCQVGCHLNLRIGDDLPHTQAVNELKEDIVLVALRKGTHELGEAGMMDVTPPIDCGVKRRLGLAPLICTKEGYRGKLFDGVDNTGILNVNGAIHGADLSGRYRPPDQVATMQASIGDLPEEIGECRDIARYGIAPGTMLHIPRPNSTTGGTHLNKRGSTSPAARLVQGIKMTALWAPLSCCHQVPSPVVAGVRCARYRIVWWSDYEDTKELKAVPARRPSRGRCNSEAAGLIILRHDAVSRRGDHRCEIARASLWDLCGAEIGAPPNW